MAEVPVDSAEWFTLWCPSHQEPRTNLVPELLDLLCELLAVLRVLPLGRLLALDHLQQVEVLLFQLLHQQMQFVEAGRKKKPGKLDPV